MSGIMDEQISLMKEHMKKMIDYMQHDNYEDCFRVLSTQYDALKKLYDIECLKTEVGMVDEPESQEAIQDIETPQEVEEVIQTVIDSDSDKMPVDEPQTVYDGTSGISDSLRPMYRVERKLRGAYIPEIDAFIPEKVLRQENIQHGDYVYAEPTGTNSSGQKQFIYELAKKAPQKEEPEGRVEYLYCPVEKDVYMYVVKRSGITGENIRLDEVPFTIVINNDDLERFNIQEGDLVDVAFYKNNPDSARIVWKHDIQENEGLLESVEPVKRNERSKKDFKEDNVTEVEQVFDGFTICIVGDKPNESSYKTLIEERGGTHLHVEPSWSSSRIETMIKKADVVVGLYDVSSHTGLEKVKEYCKEYNVPFEMISGRGKTKTIQTAIDLLQNTVISS